VNYADEATKFLDEANEAEKAALWRSEALESIAESAVAARSWPKGSDVGQLVANELRRLKANDHDGYQKFVGTNQWMLNKATANALLALVHGHEPTTGGRQ
jgi:hypothetical protein